MSMSMKKCCVPGCIESGNSHPTMHAFPNPAKDRKRFNDWVYAIKSDIVSMDNKDIYSKRSVCHAHFEEKYCCRFNRLSNIAVPTLNMPGPFHQFPNPLDSVRFNKWKSVLCENVIAKGDKYIYNCLRLCDCHFEHYYSSSSKRLTRNAIPTLDIYPRLPRTNSTPIPMDLNASRNEELSETNANLHKFPNPKNKELFNTWLYSVGGDILHLENEHIFKHRRVCHEHFEKKFWCRNNRLTKEAVPTVNMPDRWMEKTKAASKHVDHDYTGTNSEDLLRKKSTHDNKSNEDNNSMIDLEDPLGEKSASDNNIMMDLEDPLRKKSVSHNESNDDNVTIDYEDPLMGRLTHDKSEDDPMVDLEDPSRERLRTYSKPRDTTKGLKDPLNLSDNTVMELEDPLIEEWIDDTEINDDSIIDSEDPLRERLNNDSQLQGHSDDKMDDSDDTMSESDDELLTAKYKLLELFASLDDSELDSIEQWICSKAYKKDLEQKISLLKKENMLVKISNTLKKVLPFEAELPSEKIIPPTVGSQADCNEYNTCHIDEFLYDEDDVEKLVETGKVKRHYCLDCNSRNTKALTYISHSMSRQAVQYIFTVLLPKDLEDKQVLDVGSRIGAVLYGAYYFSNAGTIVGIEMNKECCDIQERIISEYSMDNNRMKIVHSDVMDRSDIVSNSDIIVINNPDFFIDIETHKKMWYFFKKYVKKGSYLVSSRSVTDTLDSLGILDELINWLSICKPQQQDNELLFDIEDYNEIFLYAVNY